MKKGDILRLKIENITFGSEGLARSNGRVIFVPGALPGEEVDVRITRKKRDYAQAKIIASKKSSEFRQQAPCEHFPVCGGCKWQDVDYSYQLELKHHIVSDTLRRLGEFDSVPVGHPIPSPEHFQYRNKMEFSFSAQRWILADEDDPLQKPGDFSLGLHVPGRFDKVLDIDVCLLQSNFANDVLQTVKHFALTSKKLPWNTHSHTGFWRNLIIREGKQTGQKMVNIVTSVYDETVMKNLTGHLLDKFPGLTSLVNNVTSSKGGSAFGEEEFLLAGQSSIVDKIGKFTFEISANSFFQTNTKQAEKLYQTALEFAQVRSNDIVYDLYSGTGTISIFFAEHVKSVVGIEVIEAAVKNAQKNAERNLITNCSFVLGDVRDEMKQLKNLITQFGRPDVLVLDPPRAGVHPKSLKRILELAPKRIVYVSCNPSTFARDAGELCEENYELVRVQPVDMFPHTYHIELVGQLERKN